VAVDPDKPDPDDLGPPGRQHVEGAPGAVENIARVFYGDANVEAMKEQGERVAQLAVQRLESQAAMMKVLPGVVALLTLVVCFCLVWLVVVVL